MNNIAKYLVEFIGTAIFLYVIIGTGNWFAIGLTLGIVILIGGPISGGNFNPAVTGMLVAAKKMPTNDLIPYVIAQLLGAMTAILIYNTFKFPKIPYITK